MSLREKRDTAIRTQLRPVVSIVRSWFLEEGLKYMKGRKMTNSEEDMLERVSDFYLDSLARIEAGATD